MLKSKILSSQRGMSLIEILIAITLIGLMGTFVAVNVIDNLREGETKSAKIQIKRLSGALLDFKRRCGLFPTSDQGLDALVEAPTSGRECKRYPPNGIVDKLPMDPWDNPFLYESDGKTYIIKSLGVDGFEGGEDFDADISSEDL